MSAGWSSKVAAKEDLLPGAVHSQQSSACRRLCPSRHEARGVKHRPALNKEGTLGGDENGDSLGREVNRRGKQQRLLTGCGSEVVLAVFLPQPGARAASHCLFFLLWQNISTASPPNH
jgi:hypothetical protein